MRTSKSIKKAICPVLLLLLIINGGCSTVYKVAVDKRSIGAQVDDEKITMSIRKKFADDKAIDLLDISVYCYRGHVYLVGEYRNTVEKHRAIRWAKSVEGVKYVTPFLLPKKKEKVCGTMDNIKLAAYVKARLIKDMEISSTNIEVKSVQCNIVLLGLVGSKAQIEKAILHARSVKGVRKVISYLICER